MNSTIILGKGSASQYRFLIAVLFILAFGIVALLLALFSQQKGASASQPASVIYVLDASARMGMPASGRMESRLALAKNALSDIISLDNRMTAGLQIFGSGGQNSGCQDTYSVIPDKPPQSDALVDHIQELQVGANENAALARAMIAGIKELAVLPAPHSLVVITGGGDTCIPDAERLVQTEADRAGIDLQIFIIGFDVDQQGATAIKGFIAAMGDQAIYFDSPDESSLVDAIQTVQESLPSDDDNPDGELAALPTQAVTAQLPPNETATSSSTSTPQQPPTTLRPTQAIRTATASTTPTKSPASDNGTPPTSSATSAPPAVPTNTNTPALPSSTNTPPSSNPPSATSTPTPSPSPTNPTNPPTNTASPPAPPTNTPPSNTNTPNPTSTNTIQSTATPTPNATNTPQPTNTPNPTATNQPTATPTPNVTNTPPPTSTNTPQPTYTFTPQPTNTPNLPNSPTPSRTAGPTATPRSTKTPLPTRTPRFSPTPPPYPSATSTKKSHSYPPASP